MLRAALGFWETRGEIFGSPFVVTSDLDKNTVTACCVLCILRLNEMAILFRILYRYGQITPE
jgi:hypothetical protein